MPDIHPYERAARQALIKKEIAAHAEQSVALNARIQRLVHAREGVETLRKQNDIRDLFCADLIARAYELPGVLKVNVYKNDWAGQAASVFAEQYGHFSKSFTATCNRVYHLVRAFRIQLQVSNAGLLATAAAIQGRIADVQRELASHQSQISSLQAQYAELSD